MNDELLYKLRPPVRAEFASAFAEHVAETTRPKNKLASILSTISRPKVWISIALGLIVVVACARELLSPNFHAADQIDDTTIYETNYLLIPSELIEEIKEHNATLTMSEPPEKFLAQLLTKEEALSQILFDPVLPTYLPTGFSENRANFLLIQGSTCMSVSYIHVSERFKRIGLIICPVSADALFEITSAPGKWEALDINGINVLLERGFWGDYAEAATPAPGEEYSRVYWDDDRGTSFYWTLDSIRYTLRVLEADIAENDLMRLVESMID